MAAGLCWGLLAACVLLACADQENVTAKTGQNITLPCRAPNHKTIIDVEWSRPDLKEEYVLLYRDRYNLDSEKQNAAFTNRVDLQDRQMKDGDVSLILENVTTADSGIFEVRVKTEANRRKRAYLNGDPICTFNLSVDPPGPTGGTPEDGVRRERHGLAGVLSVFVIIFVILIIVAFNKTNMKNLIKRCSETNQSATKV